MAHPTDWKSSQFNRPPTVDGMKELNALIACPQELTRITGSEPRWTSALLSLQAHGFPQRCSRITHTDNILNCIFDLCTILDRLTGGSTIVLHHLGATSPNADVVPESLKAEVYINPRVLAERQELHPVLAQITQTFIANYAAPLAHAFAETHSRKWGKSNAQQTPSKGKATPSKGKEKIDTILPLVPSPVSPNSAHFVFHGRPAGSLESLLNSSFHILSYAPLYDGNVIWEPTQVQIRRACTDYNNSGGSASVPSIYLLPFRVLLVRFSFEPSSAGTETQKLVSHVNKPAKSLHAPVTFYETSDSDNNNDINIFNSPQQYPPKQYLTKKWVTKLQELARIPKEHAEAILLCYSVHATHTTIMFGFHSHNSHWLVPQTRGPYVKNGRRAKRLNEDHEIQLVLNYINAKATDLAVKFKQPRRRYLERFSLGSVVHHHKHNKTSIKANSSTNKKSNQKEELIIEFDKVKKGAQDRPPNITARTHAAECARSFQFVREELKALNKHVSAEAFVIMVHGVLDFAMAPKAFFTSPATEQFVCLYLRKDIAKMATDFESTVLANGLIISEVTDDSSATVEFTRYNDLVRDYHVKLVGWNHPQWANLSDLKGGIESLEKVTSTIAEGTCKFVSITHEEVEEQMNHIKNGEKLNPELEPPMPPDALPSASPPMTATPSTGPLPNSSHPSPSPLEDENDSRPSPFENENDSGPSPFEDDNNPLPIESTHISSIINDLVDPALRVLDNSSPPPANEDALVSATNHNHKWPVDDTTPSEGQRPKRARKLTEKAQQLCSLDSDSRETDKVQRQKAKGRQRAKKSRAFIESDQENTM
ncbi:uncharacterized protein EDB91DRAFT_1086508 [Suillus paluster]|uniref:uncharacterized protein n=1 Tax=Suillus paluster TaxID=48578 RepID=UPI001B86B17D|nr:uncharacterized protein EDB91DRAFT_1086508 [Suillus paluster]KAG1727167.1 hypothetical protein EDB91DRAFT_1086508 [Suillus paluster]